ncbi:hypothetical protein [Glycomyces arizonensis]|uniref:hypothetical protein n=1 Tax=Glycomyces arizonensis TaxID=256035 RepID=UPI000412B70A|nr:hypothetical protein [Glycomyces arizonensis]
MHDVPKQASPQAPPHRLDPDKSAVAKHLCAGAHLDKSFRDKIMNEIYHRPDRALAPSPGVNTALVLSHARTARGRELGQHFLTTGVAVLIVFTTLSALLHPGMLLFLFIWALVGWSVQHAAGENNEDLTIVQLLIGGSALVALTFFAEPIIQALFYPTGASGGRVAGLWILLISLTVATAAFGGMRGVWINRIDEDRGEPYLDDRLRTISSRQGNAEVVNYSAYRKPFVGAGRSIATWQFAMPMRPKNGAETQADPVWPHFSSSALNDHIRDAVSALAADRGHSRHLPGLELADRVYVSGVDTSAPAHFLRQLRRDNLPDSVAGIQADPTSAARHYLVCQASSWDGELVTTIFIHTAIQGETLYMEFHSYNLPPTREAYHVFGRNAPSGDKRVALSAAIGAAGAPLSLITGPIGLARAAVDGIRNAMSGGGGNGDDVGAVATVRELGSDIHLHNYFQGRDAVKYTEILEAQLLHTVVEYLGDKVDTSQLTGFAETIVNHGIVNYGRIDAGAIGHGASATVGSVGRGSRGSVAK